MFRRIEVLHPSGDRCGARFEGVGCFGAMAMMDLPAPSRRCWRRALPVRSIRCFFTEHGWRTFGHAILKEIRAQGFRMRIITVRERRSDVVVLYRDQ